MSAGTSSGPSGLGAGGGECGALVRAHDWGSTPLGPVERWPSALRTAASICLESRYGICVFWGPDLVAIYNDTYAPMLGVKHPSALGTPLRDIWPEIWDQIGPMLQGVVETGEATWQEDQPLLLERTADFAEESFFTYSFSPIRGDGGRDRGRLHGRAGDEPARDRDAPPGGAGRARGGVSPRRARRRRCPGRRSRRSPASPRTSRSRPSTRSTRTARASPAPRAPATNGTARPPRRPRASRWLEDGRAVVLPVARPGAERPAAALVLGASPHLHLDEDYRGFFRMIARQLSAALSSAEGLAAVQARADELAELDRAKTEFFSNVSHEFRTPLTLMLGPLSDALADPDADPETQRERIEIAQRGALRLLRLVNALLDLSRLESGRVVAGVRARRHRPARARFGRAVRRGRRARRAGAPARHPRGRDR